MAFALLVNPPSMTASQYDDVIQALEAAGAGAPPGRLYHACFGSGDRLRIIDVWESREALDAFIETLLRLPGEWEGLDPGEIEAPELHNMVVGQSMSDQLAPLSPAVPAARKSKVPKPVDLWRTQACL